MDLAQELRMKFASDHLKKRTYVFIGLLPLLVCTVGAQTPKQSGKAGKKPANGQVVGSTHSNTSVASAASTLPFLKSHCYGCHNGNVKQGGLDLSGLKFDVNDSKTTAIWIKVHDRVEAREMPPKGAAVPTEASRAAFLQSVAAPIVQSETDRAKREGRAVWRRMNRYEYENTLRDLLNAPWLQFEINFLKMEWPPDLTKWGRHWMSHMFR